MERFLIAVVDDDRRVLESLDELLASSGYEVVPFMSVPAFLEGNAFGGIDCLICDIGMPKVSGWELLRIAKAERPELPVILITGRDEEQAAESFALKGARYFFRKPFNGQELLKAVEAVLYRGKD